MIELNSVDFGVRLAVLGGCLENFSCYFNSYVSLAYILGEQSGVCRGLRKSESLAVNAE